jgi:hypothetical protein
LYPSRNDQLKEYSKLTRQQAIDRVFIIPAKWDIKANYTNTCKEKFFFIAPHFSNLLTRIAIMPLYTLQCLHHLLYSTAERIRYFQNLSVWSAPFLSVKDSLCLIANRLLYGFWVAGGTFLQYSKYLSPLTKTPCGHCPGADAVYLKEMPISPPLLKRKQTVNLRIFQTSKTNHSPYAYCTNAILWQRTDCFIWEVPDSKYWHMLWTEYFLKQTLIFESNK